MSALISFGVTVPAAELELVGALRIVESAGWRGLAGACTSPIRRMLRTDGGFGVGLRAARRQRERTDRHRKTSEPIERHSLDRSKFKGAICALRVPTLREEKFNRSERRLSLDPPEWRGEQRMGTA